MKFIPRPIQLPMMEHVITHERCALWASMGSGKTLIILWLLATYRFVSGAPALVVGPKRVVREVWLKEAKLWSGLTGDIRVSLIAGNIAQRKKAVETPADLYLINYENLPWLWHSYYESDKTRPISVLIADEATRLKGFKLRRGGIQAKAFYLLARRAERVVELTGTPAPNGLIDLWGQLYILDQGSRLGKTLEAFKQRWFQIINCGHFNKIKPYPSAMAEIPDRVSDICLTVKSEDYYDLKEVIVNDVKVTLPNNVRKIYDKAEKEMYAELESGKSIRAFNAADCTLKCLQIANGAVYTERGSIKFDEVHSAKLDALESIVEETAGANLLVVYHFKHDLARIKKRFPQCVPFEDKPGIIDRWNEGKIPILVVNAASAGHGLNLQYGGNIIVFFAHWWNMDQREQVIERIGPMRQIQAGFERNVYQYNIITEGTIDERVLFAHAHKCGINESLMNKTRGGKV